MPTPLFLAQAPELRDSPLPTDEQSLRYRIAYINPQALQAIGLFARTATENEIVLTLNLFEDVTYDCSLIKEDTTDLYESFVGSVRGAEESRVVLTQRDSMISMDVWVDDTEFQVVPLDDDVYLIEQIDLDAPPECGDDSEPSESYEEEDDPRKSMAVQDVAVTVLLIYNSNVVQEARGVRQLMSHISLMFGNLNAALKASMVGTGATVKVQPVGIRQHDFDGMSDDNCVAKTQLSQESLVRTWREEGRADLVSILRGKATGTSCAHCLTNASGNPSSAFSAVKYSQARQRHSLSHEIGHNFGCPHNRENARCKGINADRNGSHWGYHWKHSNGKRYGTLMSYPGTRILLFSNPLVKYKGEPAGAEKANNAAAIARTAEKLARYR